jgi:hypothetical protein
LGSGAKETSQVIPVLGFATLKRFDLADRLLASIDYPVEHLVIVDNSGTQSWTPTQPDNVKNLWLIRVPFGLGLVGAWNLIVKSTPHAPYWLLVNDDAHFAEGALEIIAQDADPDGLCFPHIVPDWSCIVLGQKVVEEVGLYDERLYPLYFDDNDYERQNQDTQGCRSKGLRRLSTMTTAQLSRLALSCKTTRALEKTNNCIDNKILNNDYSEGNWSLKIRRENSWD